ncbi:MAG: potassium/proton antiporter [Bacteroidales bacterium]|nr:potassium/proton antiporter [Bacteroidales bacterium]
MGVLTVENIVLLGSILLIAGVIIGKLSYRLGLPLLFVFLLVGMGFGVDGLGIHFDDMKTAQFIGMISLCVILFSGGFDTKFSSIRPVLAHGIMLSSIGVLLMAVITGLFVWWLSGMSWSNIHFALLPSLLLGASMSSTDSASVFGILGSQKVGLKENIRPMLEFESGSNDPMAYMLTIMLIGAINFNDDINGWYLTLKILQQIIVGCVFGHFMGKISAWLLNKYTAISTKGKTIDEGEASSMTSILTLGCAFFSFAFADILGGNGYLAVYTCGIVMGNSKIPYKRGISRFVGGLSWFGQIVVFLMLGLLVNPHEMIDIAGVSLLIGAFMILVGRPISVFVSLLPFRKTSFRAKTFVAWVGLRGAAPIIFATYPVIANVEGSSQIFNIVFFVTLLSLLVQGTTIIRFSKMLKLTEEPQIDESDFGVELSEQLNTTLHTITITDEHLANGNTLKDMHLPKGQLVMMINRNKKHIVPNGTVKLQTGDVLLVIEEDGDSKK